MNINVNRWLTFDLSRIFILEKRAVADFLFILSLFTAFFGSMNVWFMLPLANYYPILAFLFAAGSYVISRTLREQIFKENYFLLPTLAFLLLSYYQAVNNTLNINAYIKATFLGILLSLIFRYDKSRLEYIATVFAKTIGGLLVVSYPFFLLYIIGFPLPHIDMSFNDGFYYFSNYFIFLIDERTIFAIIPRFQSIFLEPTYLGSTSALLLMTQRGKWKKWYNISLLVGLLISFSLAGYAYIVAIIFLNLWTEHKKIIAKAMGVVFMIAIFTGGAFVYNGGDNMLHDLILLRLEVKDGEIAGNNRVTKSFDDEYSSFVESTDVMLGRDYDYSNFGDSGYKVFLYDYGIVGVILLYIFYIFAFAKYRDSRSFISALIVMSLIFGVDAFVLWMGRFIPLYIVAMRPNPSNAEEQQSPITKSRNTTKDI